MTNIEYPTFYYLITPPYSRPLEYEGGIYVDKVSFRIIYGDFYYAGINDKLPIGNIVIKFTKSVYLAEGDLFPLIQGEGEIAELGAYNTIPKSDFK